VREVEVKYTVPNLEEVAAACRVRGVVLSEPVFQDDQAFAPKGWSFGDSKLGVSFLRQAARQHPRVDRLSGRCPPGRCSPGRSPASTPAGTDSPTIRVCRTRTRHRVGLYTPSRTPTS